MIGSAAQALGQMFDRSFRGVLWLGIGATFALFVAVMIVLQILVQYLPDFGYAWIQTFTQILAAAMTLIVFVYLGAPIAQLFASIFLDRVADAVETKYYPKAAQGPSAPFRDLLLAGLAFTAVSIALNLLALPLQFTLPFIALPVVLIVNGYLTGRTYFELVALRHMKPAEARVLRREHRLRLFLGGAFISVLAMIPFVNFAVPVFAAAMMTHEYQKLARGRG